MGDLATLPVFLKLAGRPVLVVGGSAGAAWKAELIAAAGAQVRLVAAEPGPDVRALAAEWPERVTLHRRGLAASDFDGAAIAIGAIEDQEEGERFAAEARSRGIPVNVVDKPALCDFQFGSIVNRSPLVIGISTDGGAPPLGQAIRSMIEALLPAGLQRWAAAAKAWRGRVGSAGLDGAARKAFWRRFATEAMARPNETPCPVEREAMIAGLERAASPEAKGRLALVGAGPGDPELLTLKAVRLLREADVILYDDLVNEAVLSFARREARKIHVGKRGGVPSCGQGDITSLAVLLAQEGNAVVRLKGGDPMIFGRAEEELAAADAAGVPTMIVNGISAAQGAAAALGRSLTQRGVARRVQFVTAHAETGQIPDSLDWRSIADPDATTCLYMGRKVVRSFLARGMAAGLDPATPARFVIDATLPSQLILSGIAASIAGDIENCSQQGPGLLLLGYAFAAGERHAAPPLRLAAE